MNYSNNGFQKRVAWSLIWCMIFQILLVPTQVFALTNGPKQPEFDSFTPVSTTNMVNTFTGGFNYNLPVLNIPGADGGGYALSLAYDANPNVESQATWVGSGWTLNPGALDRSKRGVPDDWKGKTIKEYNKVDPNVTVGVTGTVGLELASQDGAAGLNLSLGTTNIFNNYTGFRQTTNIGAGANLSSGSLGVSGNLGISITGRDVTFSAGVSFSINLKKQKESSGEFTKAQEEKLPEKWKALTKEEKSSHLKNMKSSKGTNFSLGAAYSTAAHLATSLAPVMTPHRGFSFNFSLQFRVGPTTFGARLGVSTAFDFKENIPYLEHNGFGYMYNRNRWQHADYNYNPAKGAVQDYFGVANAIPRPIMSDYYIEKAAPYSVRDNVVGIPFNNADDFTASGEGVAGSFRLNHNRVGHFYPNIMRSETFSLQLGGDFNIITGPFGAGGGANIGTGFQRTSSFKWLGKFYADDMFPNSSSNTNTPLNPAAAHTDRYEFYTDSEKPFFRFGGDMGGKLSYGDLKLTSATLDEGFGLPGAKFFRPKIDDTYNSSNGIDDESRNPNTPYSKQSSHIEYLLNSEIKDDALFAQNAFDKSATTKSLTEWSRTATGAPHTGTENLQDGIAQIKVWNPDGVQYIYALPSYVINERNLSYGLTPDADIRHNNLVYQEVDNDPLANETVVGQEMAGSYASTYLMTQINTYDYVDKTGNGASADDFGGYTKFAYRKWANNLYHFRSPYTGLSYSKNKIADGRDDMGSVNEGDKELYYLKAVETKSHIAIFITNKTNGATDFAEYGISGSAYSGSGETRLDGLGASRGIIGTNKSEAADNPSAKGTDQELEKLERIVLFSKDDLTKPLVSTHFQYDYSTWPNLPNNANGHYPNPNIDATRNNGKLTLKKVWFEYEGVRPYKISPYEFVYQYKPASTIKQEVRNRYPELFGTNGDWPQYSVGAECPDYNPHTLDSWGLHQYNGQEQSEKLRPWVWQGVQNNNTYDPAAWQLKQIKLPSGGEILIQYEQKDYQKVQDRTPMAMVSLLPVSWDDDVLGNTANRYYLNLEDMGIAPSLMSASEYAAKQNAIVEAIRARYVNQPKNRIYFKFLYDLTGGNAQLNSPTSEYISGYSTVENVQIDNNPASFGNGQIYLTLGRSSTLNADLSVAELDALPRKLCYDYLVYQYNFGALANFNNFNTVLSGSDEVDMAGKIATYVVPELLNPIGTTKLVVSGLGELTTVCKDFHQELSYLRIPMVTPKKGGGIRVKRIMLYDKGLETGAAELYGTEYIYENLDGTSSGVASNEPSSSREESALVDYEPRHVQTLSDRLFAGKDQKELEAPFGESLLPMPSIGHSRVVVQNIYKGATNSGFTEHTFYTCADYPYDKMYQIEDLGKQKGVDYTKIAGDNNSLYKQRDLLTLPMGFLNYNCDNVWVAQGWRFIKNDMHGKPKTVRSYGGVYNLAALADHNGDNIKDLPPASLETVYEYYQPGEKANVMRYEKGTAGNPGKYKVQREHLGMEMDVTMAMQAIKDEGLDINFEFDLGGMFPPSIEFSFSLAFSYSQKSYSNHLTSKVISFPSVTKSVTTTKNGTTTKTEYLAFSDLTGEPILTKVTDGYHNLYVPESGVAAKYDGSIYNWTIPAAWFYNEMKRPDVGGYNMLSASVGSITSYGKEGNVLANVNATDEITWTAATNTTKGVLSASAMTYKTGWLSDSGDEVAVDYGTVGLPSTVENALDAIPRPYDTYIFEGNIDKDNVNTTGNKNYEKGTIQNFVMFDWENAATTHARNIQPIEGWRWVSGVDKYSPNGYALEETNPLNIPSTAKYGYNKFLSTLVAQNAEYATVFFESFEDETAPDQAPTVTVASYAHAGKKSLGIEANNSYTVSNLVATAKLHDVARGGLQVKFWAYQPKGSTFTPGSFTISANGANAKTPTTIAHVGDWLLLSTEFLPTDLPTVNSALTIEFNNSHSGTKYIDDVRIQPKYGEMMTYVYNPSDFKVLATFDDEHFGVYYQYNEEGQLTRKYIETERGMKLLQESQYNSHTVPRNQ